MSGIIVKSKLLTSLKDWTNGEIALATSLPPLDIEVMITNTSSKFDAILSFLSKDEKPDVYLIKIESIIL